MSISQSSSSSMSFTDSDDSECEKQCPRNDLNGIRNEEGQKQKEEDNKNKSCPDEKASIEKQKDEENTKDEIIYR